jgi:hypothetical protein
MAYSKMERRGGRLCADPQPILPWGATREWLHPPEVWPSFPILYIPRQRARLNDGCAEGANDDGK